MPSLITDNQGDFLALLASAGAFGCYYAYLAWRLHRGDPLYTVQAVHAEGRRLWVESVIANGRDILGVQTLRNSTMAATFLASTAVFLVVAAISLVGHGNDVEHVLHSLNIFRNLNPALWLTKLLILVADLCWAFFSFALAIRKFNHVGYLLNIPPGHRLITPQYVAGLLNRAAGHYSQGMRAYYFTIPLLFWLFGAHLMLLATAVVLVFVYRMDRSVDAGD